ncbi:MAG: hypothetical protein V4640_05960 [Verrucomicrobiota bacterium]
MSANTFAKDDSARSPFAGCAIFIAAVAVMVFLIGFSVLTLFRQFNEIARFTGEQPALVEVTPLDGREPQLNDLAERVEKFRQDLAGEEVASLSLSADDVNLAIATHDAFKELRGTFRIADISKGALRIAISFPLNGRPRLAKAGEPGWIASDSRFLNGTLIARPVLTSKEVALAIDAIEVPGKTVAQGFIDQMSPYRVTERYLVDHEIGKAMAKLTRVEISGDRIVLTRTPGEMAATTITDAQVDSGANRLFKVIGIAACGFLAFAAVIILLGVRAKSRKR